MSRPRWGLFFTLLLGVSLVVYGIARWQPFEPGAPAAVAEVPPGDVTAGQTVFTENCALCHGAQAEGGVGPALAGSGLSAGQVLSVVASGRGAMPAGLVDGQDAADVAAYIQSISGAGAPPATPGTTTATAPAPPVTGGGTATYTGDRAQGIVVRLDAPAPADWTVWLEGTGGRRQVGTIAAGGTSVAVASVDGAPLPARYDAVIVGPDAEAPALAGELPPGRADDLLALLVADPTRPDAASALDAASSQVDVLRRHVRFLVQARDERNLANVRFHGEHMVNITRGRPLQDVDGNGEASNPGDGLGLIDGRDAHLPRISSLAGPSVAAEVRAMSALATTIAERGRVAGTSGSVAAARPAIAAIQAADARLGPAWTRLRAAASHSGVITLAAP